jgi:LysM repeat protein
MPEKGYPGHFASFDLSKLKGVLHINIDKMDIIHTQLLTKILQIPETPGRLEGESVPIRYVVPPDATVDLWDSGMPAVVKAGDTLETVAVKYRVPLWSLIQVNQIPESAALVANQRVIVPRHLIPIAAVSSQSPPQAVTK